MWHKISHNYKKAVNMKEFLEKSLQQNVTITEDKEIYKELPLVYRGRYDIFKVKTNGILWMAIQPKVEVVLLCYVKIEQS